MKKLFNVVEQFGEVIEGNKTPANSAAEAQDRLTAMQVITTYSAIVSFLLALVAIVYILGGAGVHGFCYGVAAFIFFCGALHFDGKYRAYKKDVKKQTFEVILDQANARSLLNND